AIEAVIPEWSEGPYPGSRDFPVRNCAPEVRCFAPRCCSTAAEIEVAISLMRSMVRPIVALMELIDSSVVVTSCATTAKPRLFACERINRHNPGQGLRKSK